MLTAEELLECQRDLVSRLDDDAFAVYVGSTCAASREMAGHKPAQLGRMFATHMQQQVRAAYMFQVTGDMTPLVVHAANELGDLDRFDREQAPVGCGIVRFEQPLQIRDVRGRTMLGCWLVWGPAQGKDGETGTALYWFNDHATDPDVIAEKLWRQHGRWEYEKLVGRWGIIGADLIPQQMRVGPQVISPNAEMAAKVAADGDVPAASTNLARVALALWLLLQQTIVSTREPHVRKTHARLMRRMGMPGQVTVIELRRHENVQRGEGESLVEWSHRWVVRGHWRWQPFGEGRKERRRIWIAPYVKGPDDAPLVVPEKVYRLAR